MTLKCSELNGEHRADLLIDDSVYECVWGGTALADERCDDAESIKNCIAHRKDVATDCYPELVARIAELERVNPSAESQIVGRLAAYVERCAAECGHAEWEAAYSSLALCLRQVERGEVALGDGPLVDALVEPPVEWVDGRATVGGFVLHAEQIDSGAGIEHFAIGVCAPEDDDNEETVVASIWHADAETAKRGAIAVARAMGGCT